MHMTNFTQKSLGVRRWLSGWPDKQPPRLVFRRYRHYVGFGHKNSADAITAPALPAHCLGGCGGPFAYQGPFYNILPNHFWSGAEYTSNPSSAWNFSFGYGNQDRIYKKKIVLYDFSM
jgi:hypothetical protein